MDELITNLSINNIESSIISSIDEKGRQLVILIKNDNANFVVLIENILMTAILQYRLNPKWIKFFSEPNYSGIILGYNFDSKQEEMSQRTKISKIIQEGFNENT